MQASPADSIRGVLTAAGYAPITFIRTRDDTGTMRAGNGMEMKHVQASDIAVIARDHQMHADSAACETMVSIC
jgi:hypothetical protein